MSDCLWSHGLQHTRLPCPSPSPGACSNSCLLSQWCHPTSLSSIIPFFFCLQSFPASGSFLMHLPFMSVDQSVGALASASVLPMNIQDWFPLGWTGWISLQSKGLSRVFSKSQFKSINYLALSLLNGPTLTSIHDYWHCFFFFFFFSFYFFYYFGRDLWNFFGFFSTTRSSYPTDQDFSKC